MIISNTNRNKDITKGCRKRKRKSPYKTEMKERREIKLEQKDREKRQTKLQVSTINGKGYETKRVSGPSRSMTVSFRATGWNNRLVKH